MKRLITILIVAAIGVLCPAQTEPPAAPPPSSSTGIALSFQDAPLKTALDYLSETAGFVVVEETPIQGRVTVISHQPVSPSEALTLLNTVLAEQGLAAIRNERILRIVSMADAKKMNVPVYSGADPEAIAKTDEVITQVIPLRFADARQVRDDLASLVASTADFSSNESSNTLILTDTSANVRRIVEIVRALDTHMATVAEIRVFPLRYANAATTAQLINSVFVEEASSTSQRRSTQAAQMFRGRGPGQPGGQNQEETASRAPRVTASADSRTNTVVVSGPSDTLIVVAEVIKELDANPAEDQSVFVYALKNAQAANVTSVLNSLFGQTSTQTGSTRTTGSTGTTRTSGTTRTGATNAAQQ